MSKCKGKRALQVMSRYGRLKEVRQVMSRCWRRLPSSTNCDVEEESKADNFVILKEEEEGPESPYLYPKRAELQFQGNRLVNYSLEPS